MSWIREVKIKSSKQKYDVIKMNDQSNMNSWHTHTYNIIHHIFGCFDELSVTCFIGAFNTLTFKKIWKTNTNIIIANFIKKIDFLRVSDVTLNLETQSYLNIYLFLENLDFKRKEPHFCNCFSVPFFLLLESSIHHLTRKYKSYFI